MILFAENKDAKALFSKFMYRRCCVSVIMRPAGYLISPHVGHGASWVWDPWVRPWNISSYYRDRASWAKIL